MPSATEFTLLWSTAKVALALALTLAVLIAAVWVMKRFMGASRFGGADDRVFRIAAVRYLAPRKSVALVRVFERVFIIGVTDEAITPIGELTAEECAALDDSTASTAPETSFRAVFSGLIGKRT